MKKSFFIVLFYIVLGCKQTHHQLNIKHIQNTAIYSDSVAVVADTLRIPLENGIYPNSNAFNYVEIKGKSFLSFTDNLSKSIVIYDFNSLSLIEKIRPSSIKEEIDFAKMSSFCKDMDTFYAATNYYLYRLDKDGDIRVKYDLTVNSNSFNALINMGLNCPPIFRNGYLYLSVYPDLYSNKLEDMQKWKVFCKINLETGDYSFIYDLPEVYHKNLYGPHYLMPSYCYNARKDLIIISFPADSNLYVTDFSTNTFSYNVKSKYFPGKIKPIYNVNEISGGERTTRSFLTRNSYGAVFYDPYKSRYLRVAEKKLSDSALLSRDWKKEQSLIIMNENFEIIGETIIDKNVNLYTLFFTPKGMYARTDAIKDENNLCFVKLDYVNHSLTPSK